MELVIKSIDMGNCFEFFSRRDVEYAQGHTNSSTLAVLVPCFAQ